MKMQFLFIVITLLFSACNNTNLNTKTLDNEPQSADEWFDKANNENDTTLKILYFTNAINLGSENFRNYNCALYNRANMKSSMSDYRGAIVDYSLCIKFGDCDKNRTYYHRALCKTAIKDYQSSISDFDTVLLQKSNLKRPEAFFGKAICLYNLGFKDEACINFSSAGELGCKEAYNFIKKYCNK